MRYERRTSNAQVWTVEGDDKEEEEEEEVKEGEKGEKEGGAPVHQPIRSFFEARLSGGANLKNE